MASDRPVKDARCSPCSGVAAASPRGRSACRAASHLQPRARARMCSPAQARQRLNQVTMMLASTVSDARMVPRSFHETIHSDTINALTCANGAALGSRTPDLRITNSHHRIHRAHTAHSCTSNRSRCSTRKPLGRHFVPRMVARLILRPVRSPCCAPSGQDLADLASNFEPTHSACVVRTFEGLDRRGLAKPGWHDVVMARLSSALLAGEPGRPQPPR